MILALLLAGALLALLIILLLRGGRSEGAGRSGQGGGSPGQAGGPGRHKGGTLPSQGERIAPRTCPLCASRLGPGERVKSDLSPGKGDRIMRIFGCPQCWPALPGRATRICPVCGEPIPTEGHALARYFERPGRKHVHVLGCTGCRSPVGSKSRGR